MTPPRVLTLILAGGEGGRLDLLTARRAKPAMPFAGVYRLIDFVLSNCANSALTDVWVLAQYQPHALTEHLANGRPWDLDRTFGGLRVLQPYLGRDESGWYQGNADALYRQIGAIREFDPDLILVLSADHVYRLDYREVIERHREAGAAVTIVATRVPREEAGQHGVVEVGDAGRVTGFAYKPDEPASDLIATEVFLYDAAALLDTLDALADEADADAGAEDEGNDDGALADFGDELLPRLVAAGRAREHRLDGYWRDVGTIESYFAAQLDLLGEDPAIDLDDPGWPFRTFASQRPAARLVAGSSVADSLIGPGCLIQGRVIRSVLGPGVVVEAGATVRDAIVLQDARIAGGATVERAILDMHASVGAGATVGAASDDPPSAETIALVGLRATVAAGATVAPGGRVDPAG
ncbi:MAG: Glucose-1-phosphate adenylyltransferase [uncultured Thermomicrobiales bacterium]|uniref:Glucose-1-phosphate adenylyltransferase n=1 Tax=uncultured Thermomicrobiales bacterium TaxID=1645740 RepID=A0A6J4VPK7_9BACT|nr:MAG: Glucose-1-phosphate adenylyltransferase [uncultured Thermomicrobiales bacterium]